MTLFFYGPNRYALSQQLKQMVEAYIKKAGSDMGLERVDGTAVQVRQLAASLQAVPFLASSRLVIVHGLAANKSASENIEKLVAGIPKTTVAVFVEREVDQRTKAFRVLMQADKVVKFEELSGSRLSVWVRSEAKRLGGDIEAPAARELVALAGEDQWRLAEEINKLVNFQPEVSVEAVRELVSPSAERSIFDLVEAMSAGKTAAALEQYRGLLEQRVSEMYVLTMIQWQVRNLLLAKTAPPEMSPQELAKAAGLSPYVAGKAATAQARLGERILARAYVAAAESEFAIKTGRMKADVAVERLIYQVAVAVSGQPG
jgi:DNA polymerase III delta subunit